MRPEARAGLLQPAALLRGLPPPARDLRLVSDARARRVLGGLVDVERVSHLADRLDDLGRADAVADAKPGEPVDLRERAQDEGAPAGLDRLLDPVGVVLRLDVLEVRLVEDGEHVLRHALEVRLDLAPADHRAGRVVRVAEVDDLRARADLAEDRVDVVAVVRERDTASRPRRA